MLFLVDAQLPPALARWLTAHGHPSEHVMDLGLARASDHRIWSHALEVGAVVISKDEDFIFMRSVATTRPPIVWIRRGNTSRQQLLAWFAPLFADILAGLENGEDLIEVI